MTDAPSCRDAGARLRHARLRRGLTQQRLADAVVRAGRATGSSITLSPSAVSRWESGRFEPAARYRPLLADVLGVDIDTLFPPG